MDANLQNKDAAVENINDEVVTDGWPTLLTVIDAINVPHGSRITLGVLNPHTGVMILTDHNEAPSPDDDANEEPARNPPGHEPEHTTNTADEDLHNTLISMMSQLKDWRASTRTRPSQSSAPPPASTCRSPR